jgi:hypothetical protein
VSKLFLALVAKENYFVLRGLVRPRSRILALAFTHKPG